MQGKTSVIQEEQKKYFAFPINIYTTLEKP
jgi:hypothetical protein